MDRHRTVNTPNPPASPPQPMAKFGLLARDDRWIIALRLGERIDAEHRVAATGLSLTDRRIPFAIAHPVVEAAQIGRAHVWTPVTNAHLVCRLLPEKKKANHVYRRLLTHKNQN